MSIRGFHVRHPLLVYDRYSRQFALHNLYHSLIVPSTFITQISSTPISQSLSSLIPTTQLINSPQTTSFYIMLSSHNMWLFPHWCVYSYRRMVVLHWERSLLALTAITTTCIREVANCDIKKMNSLLGGCPLILKTIVASVEDYSCIDRVGADEFCFKTNSACVDVMIVKCVVVDHVHVVT